MKTPHSDNQCKLTKWLLVVALLYSLLACLGDDSKSQNGLLTGIKTELALATNPTLKQAQPSQERLPSCRSCTLDKASQFSALRMYNQRVTSQMKVVQQTTFTFTCFAHFRPAKTIPASADGPSLGSRRS